MRTLPKFHRTCSNESNNALVIKEGNDLKHYLGTKTGPRKSQYLRTQWLIPSSNSWMYFFLRISFWLNFLLVVFLSVIHEPNNKQKPENMKLFSRPKLRYRVNSDFKNFLTRIIQDLYFTSRSPKILIYLLWLKNQIECPTSICGKWMNGTSRPCENIGPLISNH